LRRDLAQAVRAGVMKHNASMQAVRGNEPRAGNASINSSLK
jgi:hypothetical protein